MGEVSKAVAAVQASVPETEKKLRERFDKENTEPLVNNADLMYRLAKIVAEWSACERIRRIPWAKVAPRGRTLARALAEVERLMRDDPVRDLLTWADGGVVGIFESPAWNPKMRAVGGYGPWLEALAELRGHAQDWAESKVDRGRGRPIAPAWRDHFCVEIARALVQAGQRISKGRDGVFALVLQAAFDVAEGDGDAPGLEEVFPYVSRALDTLPPTTTPHKRPSSVIRKRAK